MTASTDERRRLGRIAALTLGICFALGAISRGSTEAYAVFLLPLSQTFGWDRAEASSVYSVYMLFFGLSAPLVGRLFDRWGPGVVYPLGLLCLGIGALAASQLDRLWQFYIFIGMLSGIGATGVGVVPHGALLARWFRGRLTTAIAFVSASSGVGTLILAPTVQVMIDSMGWRPSYAVMGGAILAMVLVIRLMPWRLIEAGRPADPAPVPTGMPAPAAAMTLRQALRTRTFWAMFVVNFLTAVGMFAVNPQIVAFLVETGFPPLTAASAFGAAGIAATAGLLVFGWLADRLGRLVSISISYSMTLAGMVILHFLEAAPVYWLLVLFVVVYGPSFGSRGPIIASMAASIFGRGRELGSIMGAVQMGMGVGAAVGATAGGLLHDWTGGYDWVLVFAFVNCLIPVAIFWTVPDFRRR